MPDEKEKANIFQIFHHAITNTAPMSNTQQKPIILTLTSLKRKLHAFFTCQLSKVSIPNYWTCMQLITAICT